MSYLPSELERVRKEIIASGGTVTANKVVEMVESGVRAPILDISQNVLTRGSDKTVLTDGSGVSNSYTHIRIISFQENQFVVLHNDWYSANDASTGWKLTFFTIQSDTTITQGSNINIMLGSISTAYMPFIFKVNENTIGVLNQRSLIFYNLNARSYQAGGNHGCVFVVGCAISDTTGILGGIQELSGSTVIALGYRINGVNVEFTTPVAIHTGLSYSGGEVIMQPGTNGNMCKLDNERACFAYTPVNSGDGNSYYQACLRILKLNSDFSLNVGSPTIINNKSANKHFDLKLLYTDKLLMSYIQYYGGSIQDPASVILNVSNLSISYTISPLGLQKLYSQVKGIRIVIASKTKAILLCVGSNTNYDVIQGVNINGDTIVYDSSYTVIDSGNNSYVEFAKINSLPNLVFVASSTYKKVYTTKMACQALKTPLLGVSKETKASGEAIISIGDVIYGLSGLVKGSYYYLADDGSLSTTVGTTPDVIGLALSSTELLWLKK